MSPQVLQRAMGDSMNERRETDRLPVRLVVSHILSEQDHCVCETNDLSLDGMRVVRGDEGDWGRPRHAWLQFSLPDGDPTIIRALGELRYEGPGEDGRAVRGYRFKYIYPRARRRFEAFVRAGLDKQSA